MKILLVSLFCLVLPFHLLGKTKNFKIQLLSEAQSLNPAYYANSSSSVLFYNLYRSLYFLDTKGRLLSSGKNKCEFKSKLKLVCSLDRNFKFSNGKAIKAIHYKNAFLNIYANTSKSFFKETFLSIKNTKEILFNKKSLDSIGIKTPSDFKIEFYFDSWDPEFLFKLALPVASPIYTLNYPEIKKAKELVSSGPYKIKKWSLNSKIKLTPNLNYYIKNSRPNVELILVENDITALNLFESGRLDYLRRLPFRYINKYKQKKEFRFESATRFDYIGFNKKIRNNKSLSKALTESLKFSELKKIFNSPASPGCVGFQKQLINKYHCLKFKKTTNNLKQKLKLSYSHLGGDSHSQSMQWFQNQWKKNAKLQIELDPQENGVFYQKLKENKLMIFRKGINLDRPTCLAALELFSKSHPENFIKYNNPKFETVLIKLKSAPSQIIKRKMCSAGVKMLMDDNALIPLGRMYFASLYNPEFEGFNVNDLFQLNLEALVFM